MHLNSLSTGLCWYFRMGGYVIICGNMRYKACVELGYKKMPCYILPADTPVEKLREYAIKDNIGFGDDDFGALQEWDKVELEDWGMEFGKKDVKKMTDGEFKEAFNNIKNSDAFYPIVPKYDEKYELFVIVSDNEVDANFLRERLGMGKMRSYKRNEVSKSNVIHIKDVIRALHDKDSDTKPQKSGQRANA